MLVSNCLSFYLDINGFLRFFVITTYLLYTVLVALFECQNLIGTLLCIIDLLPCFLLFLLKKGDTVGQKLSISLNAIK